MSNSFGYVDATAEVGEGVTIETGAVVASSASHRTVLMAGSSIGVGAIVTAGVRVGLGAVVSAGAVVTSDVPPKAILSGNPGTIVGYVDALESVSATTSGEAKITELGVDACALWQLPRFTDLRGSLSPVEFDRDLPFVPARSFVVFDVPSADVRGEHAHKQCHQFLIATHGELSVVLDNGSESAEVRLDRPDLGLFLPAGVWGVQYKFSSDAVLCVYASHGYDNGDYIRSYQEFLDYRS